MNDQEILDSLPNDEQELVVKILENPDFQERFSNRWTMREYSFLHIPSGKIYNSYTNGYVRCEMPIDLMYNYSGEKRYICPIHTGLIESKIDRLKLIARRSIKLRAKQA